MCAFKFARVIGDFYYTGEKKPCRLCVITTSLITIGFIFILIVKAAASLWL